MLTKQQATAALEWGWKKRDLYFVHDWGGKITYQTPHFMVLDEKYHIYRIFGAGPWVENKKIAKATGWADGSGTNSRHPGGIGVVIESPSLMEPKLIHHNIGNASNNLAELMAVYRILIEIPDNQAEIVIRTDSAYSIGILTDLSWNIKANHELVNTIREDLSMRPNVTIKHVKGHEGTYYQEMADALAGVARKYAPQTIFF